MIRHGVFRVWGCIRVVGPDLSGFRALRLGASWQFRNAPASTKKSTTAMETSSKAAVCCLISSVVVFGCRLGGKPLLGFQASGASEKYPAKSH